MCGSFFSLFFIFYYKYLWLPFQTVIINTVWCFWKYLSIVYANMFSVNSYRKTTFNTCISLNFINLFLIYLFKFRFQSEFYILVTSILINSNQELNCHLLNSVLNGSQPWWQCNCQFFKSKKQYTIQYNLLPNNTREFLRI